ncbi:hypothetical protein [Xanthocytophaga agilis]|uniref:DUF3592 domain-containing protein n=1 Tax=Xanthocytophaga agilis TaxID=3048010 RepID=A0AAE3R781_9BACT|nr:hypothetical protein [Xanthocytophaga agilis]MDJ1502734.1 hypothetical protein [Xanthocytophaga agilis]
MNTNSENTENNKRIVKAVVVALLIALCLVFLVKGYDALEIKYNSVLTVGQVTEIRQIKSRNYGISYTYTVNGYRYAGYTAIGGIKGDEKDLVNKSLPIVYSSKHPDKNTLLVSKDDFDFYNVSIPDSFKVVLKRFY